MFRVELFVDDKKLGNVLHALAGMVLGDPKVQPVTNAVAKNGKVQANGSGSAPEMFARYLKAHNGLVKLTPEDMRNFCKYAGWSPTSSSYFAKQLVDVGLIKKIGKGSHVHYLVKK